MGDALAGEVLEIAGLENLHHAILDVVGEPLLVAALDRRRQRVGGLVDLLGRLQDRLRRLLGAADDGVQARGARARSVRCRARRRRARPFRLGCARPRHGSGRARACRPAPRRSAPAPARAHRGPLPARGSISVAQRLQLGHELAVPLRACRVVAATPAAMRGARAPRSERPCVEPASPSPCPARCRTAAPLKIGVHRATGTSSTRQRLTMTPRPSRKINPDPTNRRRAGASIGIAAPRFLPISTFFTM